MVTNAFKVPGLALAFLFALVFTCCQQQDNSEEIASEQVADTLLAAVDTTFAPGDSATISEVPAAPEKIFHKLPNKVAKKRVFICDNNSAPDFHEDFECPRLKECSGNFKNVSVLRAVEDYYRSFCPVCSKHYAEHFKEGFSI